MPRIWVSQPGISHSNANGTPETVSSPKRRSRTATATAKRKQQQKAKHKTKCKFFAVYFCFALLFFYVHLWQNANSNVQQQTTRASRRVCSVCNVCVLHRPLSSPFSLYLVFVTLLPRGFCRCCCCLHGNLSSQRIAFNCNFATLQLPQSATATTATTAHPTPSYIPSAMSSRQQRKKLCKTPCDAANVKRCAYKECVFVLPHTHVAACTTKSKRNAPTITEGKGLGKVKS